MSDTPAPDRAARVIAENVYVAFCQQATMAARPLEEQTILTRLVEAIRPQIGSGAPGAIVEAANAALSAWEQRDLEVRGPRVVAVNQIDGAVTLGYPSAASCRKPLRRSGREVPAVIDCALHTEWPGPRRDGSNFYGCSNTGTDHRRGV